MTDKTRSLMRWLAGNDLPNRIVVACPSHATTSCSRRDVVVRVPHCLEPGDTGLIAQVIAAGAKEVAIGEHCQGTDSLTRLFPSLQVIPTSQKRRWWHRRPRELSLDAIEIPRRTVLGLPGATELPFDWRDEESQRVLAAFRHLDRLGKLGEGRSGAQSLQLSFNGCIACGVCTRACPTGALQLTHGDKESQLSYDAAACRGDLDCVNLCPSQAIVASQVMEWSDIVAGGPQVVARIETQRCGRCQMPHHQTESDLCSHCRTLLQSGYGPTTDIEELKRRAQAYRRAANLTG